MVIYADLLFLENLLANCFILKLASILSGSGLKTLKAFIAASFGAVYAVIAIIFPDSLVVTSTLTKIAISILMSLIAFKIRNLSEFLRRWGMILLSAFVLAGCTYALSGVLSGGVIAYGGLMYVSPQGTLKALLLSAGLSVVLVRPIGRILSGKALREGSVLPVHIKMGEKTVRINALLDTGNSLIDPLTGYPVMIVEAESIKELLPSDVYKSVVTNNIDLYTQFGDGSDSSWLKRVHLIPYKSVGKENGMLTGFRPDCVHIVKEGVLKEINDVVVGVCGIKLSCNSRYSALLGPAMLTKM